MREKMTHEEFLVELSKKNKHFDTIEIISNYQNRRTKVDCKCKICGYEWSTTPKMLYKGHGCKMCISKINGIKKTKSHEEFLNEVKPEIEVLSNYTNSHDRIDCRCKICGNEWSTLAYNLTNGKGCPECAKEYKRKLYARTQEEFLNEFNNTFMDAQNIEITGKYINSSSIMECECKVCGGHWKATATVLLKNKNGCPICLNKKVYEGVNDIATIRPDLVEYFEKIEDSKKYTTSSHAKVTFVCPHCGAKKKQSIRYIVTHGFNCDVCGDTLSYPNKFAYSFLSLLPITNHIKEYSPEWIKPKRYDNYFEYNNHAYILEMDGDFHYKDTNWHKKEYIQENDKYKDELAKQHGITLIRIDCQKSDPEYIRSNIENSELNSIFDLTQYDWDKCFRLSAYNTSLLPIWEYANNHLDCTVYEIAKHFDLSYKKTSNILIRGQKSNMCDYRFYHGKPVEVYKNNQLLYNFNTVKECREFMNQKYKIPFNAQGMRKNLYGKKADYHGFTFKFIQQ